MPEYTGVIGTAGDEPAPVVEVPEYTEAIGTAGDEPAPVVEVPEYTGVIGTAGDEPAPVVEVPEYTEAIGTAGDEPAPVLEVPEYTGAIGTAGDEPAPVVEVPEYTGVIGTAGDEPAPVVEVPEYTGVIGTAGDEPAPVVEVPEYTGVIGTAGDEPAPVVEVPEYTGVIGTVGDEPAPVVEVPEFKGGVNAAEATKTEVPEYTGSVSNPDTQEKPSEDKLKSLLDETGKVEIIGRSKDLGTAVRVESKSEVNKELAGKTYDIYHLQLKDDKGKVVKPGSVVIVRLPLAKEVETVYAITATNELQELAYTVRDGKVEFTTTDLTAYAIVYKTVAESVTPSEEQKPAPTVTNQPSEQEKLQESTPEVKEQLPATGEKHSVGLALLGSLGLLASAAFIKKGKRD